MSGAIDILCNHFTPENLKRNFIDNANEAETFESAGIADNLQGLEPKEFIAYIDETGIDKVLITALKSWSLFDQRMQVSTSVDEIVEAATVAPDRILGLYGINPMARMNGVRELEAAVVKSGFKGAHIHPHGYDLPLDHAYYFPFYAKCMELDVPVVVSMGHTLDRLPIDVGHPTHLDRVALYFPELRIVCTHTGWPWVEEAIALVSKHPNMFLGTSAYAPKYWKPEMVKFINSRGKDKVMWGTDYPVIKHDRSLREIGDLGLNKEAHENLLHRNAVRVFGF